MEARPTMQLIYNSDGALIQVEIVDAAGQAVHKAQHSVTFSVAGAGKLIGAGNGTCVVCGSYVDVWLSRYHPETSSG